MTRSSTCLSTDALRHYSDHGYVVPDYRLDDARIGSLREALGRVMAANPQIRPEKLVNVHISSDNSEGVRGDDAFFEMATDPVLLDMVEQLIGPDIILWGCQAFCKPAGDGLEVPMHQDGQYWPIRPLATCTVWIAIDDSHAANGCLKVVPGSHLEGRTFAHETVAREDVVLTSKVADPALASAAVDVELDAGQMSLHDVHLVHGSNANRSPRRRAGLAIRYMPASSVFERDLIAPGDSAGYRVDFSRRPLWLLRGHDASSRNDFRIGHLTPGQ